MKKRTTGNPYILGLTDRKPLPIVVLVPDPVTLQTVCGIVIFAVLACWNVLERRNYAPKRLVDSVASNRGAVETFMKKIDDRVLAVEAAEEKRRLENVGVHRQFVDLLEQQDDILERIDTKRRRADASLTRLQAKQGNGGEPQVDVNDVDQVRALARSTGRL